MELPRLFLELAVRPTWTTRQEGPLSGKWPRTEWPLWRNYRVPWLKWENLPKGQQSLQHFINLGLMGEWPDGSHSWEKGKWQHAWSSQKGTWKILRAWSKRLCSLLRRKLNSLAWMQSTTSGGNWAQLITNLTPSIPHTNHPTNMVPATSCFDDAFQWQGLGDL